MLLLTSNYQMEARLHLPLFRSFPVSQSLHLCTSSARFLGARASIFPPPRWISPSWGRKFECPCWGFSERVRKQASFLFAGLVTAVLVASPVALPAGPHPAWALSEENLLFLEAWRTIDRAYIDKSFNGQSWFRYRENALRDEPMNNREETYAAIRKMIATLDDPFTRFLEPEKFNSLRAVWNTRISYRSRVVNRLPYKDRGFTCWTRRHLIFSWRTC